MPVARGRRLARLLQRWAPASRLLQRSPDHQKQKHALPPADNQGCRQRDHSCTPRKVVEVAFGLLRTVQDSNFTHHQLKRRAQEQDDLAAEERTR